MLELDGAVRGHLWVVGVITMLRLKGFGTARDPANEWFVQGWCSLVHLSLVRLRIIAVVVVELGLG